MAGCSPKRVARPPSRSTGRGSLSTFWRGCTRPRGPPHCSRAPPRRSPLETIAGDVGRALSAVARIDTLDRERRSEVALEEVMRHAAANDADAAARAAAAAFDHHAVAVRALDGHLLGLHADDRECRDAALDASAKVAPAEGGAVRVGIARHGRAYAEEESQLAE